MRLLVLTLIMKVRKMTDIFTYCSFFLLCIGVISCREAVIEQETTAKVFANYYVRYQQAEEKVKAQASFLSGDSIAVAQPKIFLGGVSFQGQAMQSRELRSDLTRYELDATTEFNPPFQFKFKDDGRKTQEFLLNLETFTDFSVKDKKVSKSEGGEVLLDRGALQSGERLIFLLIDHKNKTSTQTFDGPLAQSQFVIPKEKLAALAAGKAQLYIVKRKDERIKRSNMEISATIEYYSTSKEFEILE